MGVNNILANTIFREGDISLFKAHCFATSRNIVKITAKFW